MWVMSFARIRPETWAEAVRTRETIGTKIRRTLKRVRVVRRKMQNKNQEKPRSLDIDDIDERFICTS